MKKNERKWSVWKAVLGAVVLLLVAGGVAVYLNWEWVTDWWRGVNYAMTEEMGQVKAKLGLTERGEFLFRAAQPKLNDDAEFNQNCRTGDTEVAILGCYTDKTIYVYKIEEPELEGIVETTTAHELLHAVFGRMTETEKASLKLSLEQVLAENQWVLTEDLESYAESERFEELYVRAGTEIKNLPADLEKHYGEIFEDQDKIANFYNSYISVFRSLRKELDDLETEMAEAMEEVETRTGEYEKDYAQLMADIVSFNSCAEVEGCFKTTKEFNTKRSALISRQEILNKNYDKINELIDAYNENVEKYNNAVIRGENLNQIINSNKKSLDKI